MNKSNQKKNFLIDLTKTSNMTVEKIINFYESQRNIMPNNLNSGLMKKASNLLEISDNFDVFIFDSYGVLNIGNKLNPNVRSVLNKLKLNHRQFRKEVVDHRSGFFRVNCHSIHGHPY